MKFVDAHIHLSDSEYKGKTSDVVQVAKQVGVVAMVSNGMNLETSKSSLKLAEENAGVVYAALGIHPWNVNKVAPNEFEETVDFIAAEGSDKRVVAIGEIGLDPQYAKGKMQKEEQARVFHEMLRLAEKLALPIVVHSRWSAQRILDILPSYRLKRALWHWFSGPTELLPSLVQRGDYISQGPPVVFSARIQEIVRAVPLERLISETDGPVRYYGPFKDRPTTPAFIPEVVKAMAQIKEVDENYAAERILGNFSKLFHIPV